MRKLARQKFAEYLEQKFFWVTIIVLSLIISFITASMTDFYQRAYEREYNLQMETLEDLAIQGSMILEERLNGYLNTLEGAAVGFQEGPLHTEENMQRLKQIVETNGIEFARMALVDADGNSWITNGEKLNVSDKDYFQKAIRGRSNISESFASRVVNANVFIAAVPIVDEQKQVRGVLYGVVEIEEFQFYKDTSIEEAQQNIQVIDKEGDYIVKSGWEGEGAPEGNLFEGLRKVKCSMPYGEMLGKASAGEDMLLQIEANGSEYVLFLSKLTVNDWYIVTILGKNNIFGDVSYLLGKDVYLLILKVAAAFAIVCFGSIWYMRRDKKKIEKLYNQLKLNEEMIRTAVAAGRSGILFYDSRADRLKIIMRKQASLELPKVVEHASENLIKCLPPNEKTARQVAEIFEKLKTIDKNDNLEFSLEINGELRDFMMHVETMVGEGDKDIHYVGIADDITEKTFLVREMKMQENLFSSMVGFLVVDLNEDRILRSSKRFQEQCKVGQTYSRLYQDTVQEKIVPEYQDYVKNSTSVKKLLASFENNSRKVKLEYPYREDSGRIAWMEGDIRMEKSKETGHCLAYIVFRDISDTKDTEQLLRERANKDYLTGLYNRRSTVEMIDQFLLQPSAAESTHAFVIFDLDNFKMLNDIHGHQTGDAALIDVANILSRQFRKYDIVSRLAGDEFVLFLKNIPLEVTETKVKELLKELHLTYTKDGKEVSISASAGIAVTPEHGMDFSALYQNADKALYKAKNAAKGSYAVYGQEAMRG